MEQHAIPRQITSFEFKLIGFMTLRQFMYLVVAFPLAYVVYVLFPIPLLNILLAAVVGGAGLVTAFVPIQDRSLDIWAKTVWKRLQNPTQYYYHKRNDPLYFLKDLYFLADPHHMLAHIESKEKLAQYLAMTKQRPQPNVHKKEVGVLLQSSTASLQKETAAGISTDIHSPSAAMQEAMQMSAALAPQPLPVAAPPIPPVSQAPRQVLMQTEVVQQPHESTTITAKVIPPQATISGNQPFLSGVVRTSKRIPIPGILIYIKDDSGNPLRLMKSNPHGVFATFNPLQPGNYTFEIKDPTGTYFFDTMKVPVQETNTMPVEFMSKEIL